MHRQPVVLLTAVMASAVRPLELALRLQSSIEPFIKVGCICRKSAAGFLGKVEAICLLRPAALHVTLPFFRSGVGVRSAVAWVPGYHANMAIIGWRRVDRPDQVSSTGGTGLGDPLIVRGGLASALLVARHSGQPKRIYVRVISFREVAAISSRPRGPYRHRARSTLFNYTRSMPRRPPFGGLVPSRSIGTVKRPA
jgi:hypothetical protein